METHPILRIHQLSKRLGNEELIKPLSLTVNKGEIYGFLGPNGAGKTTTLRMMTGLVFPTSGEITIAGISLKDNPFEALANVGSIIETPAFYPDLSAKQNLTLSAKLAKDPISSQRIVDVLQLVELSQTGKQKVRTFSLGMKQRLGIANALLCSPRLIILDEPTTGVDPLGLRDIKRLVKQLASEGITFLISSHMLREMEDLCHKVAFIQSGRLIEEGAINTLLHHYQVTNLEDLYFACMKGRPL